MGQLGFPDMATIIPESKSGNFGIWHMTLTQDRVDRDRRMAIIKGRDWTHMGLVPGIYCVLYHKDGFGDEVVMSDT